MGNKLSRGEKLQSISEKEVAKTTVSQTPNTVVLKHKLKVRKQSKISSKLSGADREFGRRSKKSSVVGDGAQTPLHEPSSTDSNVSSEVATNTEPIRAGSIAGGTKKQVIDTTSGFATNQRCACMTRLNKFPECRGNHDPSVNVCRSNREKDFVSICRNYLIHNGEPHRHQRYLQVFPNVHKRLTNPRQPHQPIPSHPCPPCKHATQVSPQQQRRRCRRLPLQEVCVVARNESTPECPKLRYQEIAEYPRLLREMNTRKQSQGVRKTLKRFEQLSKNMPVTPDSTSSENDVASTKSCDRSNQEGGCLCTPETVTHE